MKKGFFIVVALLTLVLTKTVLLKPEAVFAHSNCSSWPTQGWASGCNCSVSYECDGNCGGVEGCGYCEIDPGGECVQYKSYSSGRCGPYCVPQCFSCDDARRTNRESCTVTCSHCSNNTTCSPCPTTPPPEKDTPTPKPSNPPPPTETPLPTITPTPTIIQPTQIITLAPTATPPQGVYQTLQENTTQRWICLNADPCSSSTSCSGKGDPTHRVRLYPKTDTKPFPGKPTYIFECLQTAQGLKCTTGNEALDNEILDSSFLPSLQTKYGYYFSGFFAADGETNATNPTQSSNNGEVGPFEWESATDQSLGRVFMAVNILDNNEISGYEGGQQQGSFIFESEEKTCIMIWWDPYGKVFDIDTLQPIPDVSITLLKKRNNSFSPVSETDVLGKINNPLKTLNDGSFAFHVGPGVYKLLVSKPGYLLITDPKKINSQVRMRYKNIYQGEEIVVQKTPPLINIALQKITLFNHPLLFFLQIFI